MAARKAGPSQPPRDPRQLTLDHYYELPQPPDPVPGSLNCAAEVCQVLSDELARARNELGLSRAVIAARMSDLTGQDITLSMLNAFTAESHDRHRFPFEFAAAFEVACETTALQLLVARHRGTVVLHGAHERDIKLARIKHQMARLRDEERRLLRRGR